MKTSTIIKTLLTTFIIASINEFYAQSYVPDELIVQLKDDVTPDQLSAQHSLINLTQKQRISDVLNIWLFKFNLQSIQSSECLNLIRDSKLVKTAQFNHYIFLNSTPNDPGLNYQYGLNKIKAIDAWNINTGGTTIQNDQIVIAIIDDGFDINHQDIDFWKNTAEIPNNGIDDDLNDYPDDYDGWNAYNNNGTITSANHGTHVAGIAGAKGNNGDGVSGVNWNVKIMPIQASYGTEATVLAGYSYVLKMRKLYNQSNGAQGAFIVVTNASFSTWGGNVNDYPSWCGIYESLGMEGVLNINAPWNLGSELGEDFNDIPGMCSSQYLIVVSNTDQNDNLHNSAPWSKSYIDLVAPGTSIYSTLPGNSYDYDTGTSMAAPHVAGAVALMYAAACNQLITNYKLNPSAVALSIKQLILNWSDPIYSLLQKIGYGRLNIYRSILKMSEQYDNEFYVSGIEASLAKQYDAIQDIFVENYTAVGNHNIIFRSGNSITFKPETNIIPEIGKTIHALIDETYFDCAIPIQPLTTDVIVPANPFCGGGFISITCNTIPTGGKQPYSYEWYSKVVSSNTWITHNFNSPNISFVSNEDFHVQAKVTDDRGISALSPITLVNCFDARMASQLNLTGTPPDSIINLTISRNSKTISKYTSENEINYLIQKFNAFPNPTTGNVTISFSLDKASKVSIQITDNTGKKVADVINNQFYEIGTHNINFDNKDFSVGIYFYTIFTNEGINVLKLVLLK